MNTNTSASLPINPNDTSGSSISLLHPASAVFDATSIYGGGPRPTPITAIPLPVIPGYQILGQIGRGGMGIIYHARHLELRREVAIKMLLGGTTLDASRVVRFQGEAQTTARLLHPHIVQLYEMGTWGDLPYLCLEYVPGGSLRKRLESGPLPPRVAAELLEKVARAVHFAHEQGVLHRDLKPGNILLTQDGTPKVADFGLAWRADHDETLTHTGMILGTPNYMAPEQVQGDRTRFGPAVDVYALGVILYEAVTGRPPFQIQTHEDLMQIPLREPVPPSAWKPGLPRDLEVICMKCLRREATSRYPSAQALAEDLHRFLDGRPITARPLGLIERYWRWSRRNPSAAALAGSLVLLVTLTLIGMTALAIYAERQWERAVNGERMADLRFQLTRQVSDDLIAGLADRLQDTQDIPLVRRDLLSNACKVYEGILRENRADDELRRQAERLRWRLGQAEQELGDSVAAQRCYRTALVELEELGARHPEEADVQADQAACYLSLGILLDSQMHREEGRQALEEAYRKYANLLTVFPPPSKGSASYLRGLAATHKALGLLHRGEYRFAEALERITSEAAVLEQLQFLTPDDPGIRFDLAVNACNRGFLLRANKSQEDGWPHLVRSRTLLEELLRAAPERIRYRRELGLLLARMGTQRMSTDYEQEARSLFTEAIALQERLREDFPNLPSYTVDLAGSVYNYALALGTIKQADESAKLHTRALHLIEPVLVRDPQSQAAQRVRSFLLYNRAAMYHDLGQHDACLADLDLLLDDARAAGLLLDYARAGAHRTRAHCRAVHLQRYSDAERDYRRALEVNRTLEGPTSAGTEECLRGLVQVLQAQARPTEAIPVVRELVALLRGRSQPEEAALLQAEALLASLLLQEGKASEATPLLRAFWREWGWLPR